MSENNGSDEYRATRFGARLDVSAIDGCFDPTLLRVLFLDAFGNREPIGSGKFDLGVAVALPSLERVIDSIKGSGGTFSGGCDEGTVVFLRSNVFSEWEWCRSSRRRCS